MRSTLVFPPLASPTYVPFGLALLVSHIQQTLPQTDLRLVDVNLSVWQQLTQAHPNGHRLISFLHHPTAYFFNPTVYQDHNRIWDQIRQRMGNLSQKAKHYLERGGSDSELVTILTHEVQAILANDPVIVGISVMYLDQLNFALALAYHLKRCESGGHRKLVLGGAALSALNTDELMRACPFIDALVIGEGENAMTALLAGKAFTHIPGLCVRTPDGLTYNQRLGARQAGDLVKADFSQFSLAAYYNPEGVLPVFFSRDCRWRKCRFCAHNFAFSGFRQKTIAGFVDELAELQQRYGVSHFYFTDQYIEAVDLERIAEEILARKLRLSYHVMGRPVADYTPARLEKLALSGCRWISWGVESGSQRLLDLVKKGTKVQDIETVIQNAAQVGISNLAMVIFGLPTSTEVDLWQTISLLERLQNSLDAIRASAYVLYEQTYFAKRPALFDLTITGARQLLTLNGVSLHSNKLLYSEIATDGSRRPPCSIVELTQWEKRRGWLKNMDFWEHLPCEHYLLYCDYRYQHRERPETPFPKSA